MRPLLFSRLAVRPPTTDLLLAAGVTAVGQAEIWLTDAVEPKPLLAGLALLVTPHRWPGDGAPRWPPCWPCWAPMR